MSLSRLLCKYKVFLNKHPVAVQVVQVGALMATGDIIAQTCVEKKPIENLDYKRTSIFALVGLTYMGPALTLWYRTLSRMFNPLCDNHIVIKKVALDQLLFAPVILAGFISIMSAIHGNDVDSIKQDLERKYPDILLTNYKIWPAVQLFNFSFVPLNFQTLVVQVVAIFWNAYLSWRTQILDCDSYDPKKEGAKTLLDQKCEEEFKKKAAEKK